MSWTLIIETASSAAVKSARQMHRFNSSTIA